MFDTFDDKNYPFEFVLGNQEVIEGLEMAIETMKKGEEAQVRVHPAKAYGSLGNPPKIPSNAWLDFELTLIDF